MKKKFLSLLLAFTFVIANAVTVTAQEAEISLRIEGISKNKLYEKELIVDEGSTVADVIKSVVSPEDYVYTESTYGGYFSAFYGEEESTFGINYDGWQFRVNDERPNVGVSSYTVEDGDDIVMYYGDMNIAYPNTPILALSEGKYTVTFTYESITYDSNWNAVYSTEPITDATVIWGFGDGETDMYVTDAQGQIELSDYHAAPGTHSVGIEKYHQNGQLPLVVRFAPDYTLTIPGENSGVEEDGNLDPVYMNAINYLQQNVPNPQVGSVGGEWGIIGAAVGKANVDTEYFKNYLRNVKKYADERNGVLHSRKYTEYSRVVLALSVLGIDAGGFCGYNFIEPLLDYESTIQQGLNGPVWALIALSAADYEHEIKDKYIEKILSSQLEDGGFSLTGEAPSDPDFTAMSILSLSKYRTRTDVAAATNKAVDYLSSIQKEDGGFTDTSETTSQVIIALYSLGIDASQDARFQGLTENLISFRTEDGGFKHILTDETANVMASEQACLALTALIKKSADVFRSDIKIDTDFLKQENIIEIKFNDVKGTAYEIPVSVLASAGIVNGRTETEYVPGDTMTRAEFAAIISRGLKLEDAETTVFDDVKEEDWYYGYVGAAHASGLIKGISETEFAPKNNLTREAAAVIIARDAQNRSLVPVTSINVRDALAGFSDYVQTSDWAVEGVAYCVASGILPDDDIELRSTDYITRGEMAEMLYNYLVFGGLL